MSWTIADKFQPETTRQRDTRVQLFVRYLARVPARALTAHELDQLLPPRGLPRSPQNRERQRLTRILQRAGFTMPPGETR